MADKRLQGVQRDGGVVCALACVALTVSLGCSGSNTSDAEVADDVDTTQGMADQAAAGDTTSNDGPEFPAADGVASDSSANDMAGDTLADVTLADVGDDTPLPTSSGEGGSSDVGDPPSDSEPTTDAGGAMSASATGATDNGTDGGDEVAEASQTNSDTSGDDTGVNDTGITVDDSGSAMTGEPTGNVGGACGAMTCADDEYCEAPCSGVGAIPDDAEPRCVKLPQECNGVGTCECICGDTMFFCTPGAPEVSCGCG